MNIKEMMSKYGMSVKDISVFFCIPYRTVQDWKLGKRKPPDYVLSMMEQILVASKVAGGQ